MARIDYRKHVPNPEPAPEENPAERHPPFDPDRYYSAEELFGIIHSKRDKVREDTLVEKLKF